MPDKPTLYVCSVDDGWPPQHPCRRAQRALRDAGHDFEKIVFDKGHPFGLFTKGKRPELKEISGQEMLPVLQLPDGSTVNGGANIVDWASANAPATAPAPAEVAS
jgi:glutathione S-transferase